MGNIVCGYHCPEVLQCAECGREAPQSWQKLTLEQREEWRWCGAQVLCNTCSKARQNRRRTERRQRWFRQVKVDTFGVAVKQPPLPRIQSGKEWLTPSCKGTYKPTMSETVKTKVTLAQLRLDLKTARLWLGGQASSDTADPSDVSATSDAADSSDAPAAAASPVGRNAGEQIPLPAVHVRLPQCSHAESGKALPHGGASHSPSSLHRAPPLDDRLGDDAARHLPGGGLSEQPLSKGQQTVGESDLFDRETPNESDRKVVICSGDGNCDCNSANSQNGRRTRAACTQSCCGEEKAVGNGSVSIALPHYVIL